MDIQGWLQGTADRAPPNPSDEVVALTFGHPSPGGEAVTKTKHRRKRKQPDSDSSIIAPQRRNERRGKVGDQSAHGARDRLSDMSVPRSNSASRHRRPVSQVHGTHDNIRPPAPDPYERRARHKTKPDRYEPKKQKGRKRKQRDDTGEQKSKRQRDRAHRGGDGKRTESLVQGFRLKNGPSKTRLTLKPDTTAGLFKHGRASTQLNGRSNGLPDLAFNELKFLQNPDEHQDRHEENGTTHKLSIQERKRAMEREKVSAYFGQRSTHDHAPAPNPPQTRQDDNRQTIHANPTQRHTKSQEGSSPVLPNEELPTVPYFGFGSKGNVNHSGNTRQSVTTYFTWSESIVGPGVRNPHVHSTIQQGQSLVSEGQNTRRCEHGLKARLPGVRQMAREDVSHKSTGQWKPSRRALAPAENRVYVDPGNAGPPRSIGLRKSHDTTYPSLPTKRAALSDRGRHLRQLDEQRLSSDAGSFNTSDILKVRGRLGALVRDVTPNDHRAGTSHHDKENVQPISSSPTAKIMRTAQEAMASNEKSFTAPLSKNVQGRHDDVAQLGKRHAQPLIAIPSHQLAPLHLQGSIAGGLSQLHVHASPSIDSHYLDQRLRQHVDAAPADDINWEDEEMLDNKMSFSPQVDGMLNAPFTLAPHVDESIDDQSTYRPQVDEHQDSRLGRSSDHAYAAPAAISDMHSVSLRYDRPSTRPRGVLWSRGGVSTSLRNTFTAAIVTDQDSPINRDHVDDRDFEDGLEGFWRPNKLY